MTQACVFSASGQAEASKVKGEESEEEGDDEDYVEEEGEEEEGC